MVSLRRFAEKILWFWRVKDRLAGLRVGVFFDYLTHRKYLRDRTGKKLGNWWSCFYFLLLTLRLGSWLLDLIRLLQWYLLFFRFLFFLLTLFRLFLLLHLLHCLFLHFRQGDRHVRDLHGHIIEMRLVILLIITAEQQWISIIILKQIGRCLCELGRYEMYASCFL